ncbi:uncharacterized protein LOC132548908 [Ylistrum balloti]|uniref:uncharacterized protein LOC132548908 n=1 Tax=Ylistrum balloti TaxID=509963 RepID=UPI0029058899|nr:uncharacterized protein LOC132548908 [Ylistrum balloti]
MSKTKLYVGGLVDDVGNDRLHRTFEKFGKIKKVWVARNPGSKGFAFIDFYEPEHAMNASVEMNGKHVFGSNIKVELSTNGIDNNLSEKHKNDRNYDSRRGNREYDFRRGDSHYDDRRGDWDRDRRRGDRCRDYARRRSPPPYPKRRSNEEDDEDFRLADMDQTYQSAVPRTIDILKQLEKVTRQQLEREFLKKIRRLSEIRSDGDPQENLDHLSRPLAESSHISHPTRNRDLRSDDSFLKSVDQIFRDQHMQEETVMFDSNPNKFNSQCSNIQRGHRYLLPTPDFPKLNNSQSPNLFPGTSHLPQWHIPSGNPRAPWNVQHRPFGNTRKHVNGNHKYDWYGKQHYGFGYLSAADSSINKKVNTSQPKPSPLKAPPVQEHQSTDTANTS